MDFFDLIPIACGLAILLWVAIRLLIKRRRCTYKVTGRCVEHKKRHNKYAYSPVYEIPWKDGTIRIHSSSYINKPGKLRPAIGDTVKLSVNPENPLEFSSRFDLQNETAPILVALIFIFIPIYFRFFHH